MVSAGRIREAAKRLRRFDISELADAVGVQTYAERRKLNEYLKDFRKRKEIERYAPACYLYKGRSEVTTMRQRLWDIARYMVRFSISDLSAITEGNREYIIEFCGWMAKAGYARRIDKGQYQVIGRLGPVVPKGEQRRSRR